MGKSENIWFFKKLRDTKSNVSVFFYWKKHLILSYVLRQTYVIIFQDDRNFLLSVLKPLLGVNSSFLEALNRIVFLWLFSSMPWIQ